MDIREIFSGLLGFVIEEVIVGTMDFGILFPVLLNDMQVKNNAGFSSAMPLFWIIFMVILIAPVLHHFDDLIKLIN